MAVYWHTCLAPRRKVAAQALERARAEGLIREEADTEILLDLIGGAIIYRLLISPGDNSQKHIRAYLRKLAGELGLRDPKGDST